MQRTNHWHPLLAAIEQEPGVWHLASQTGVYAIVRLIEVGGERGYRATTFAEPRRLIGYRRSLRGACELAHRQWLRQHGPDPGADQYPDLSGTTGGPGRPRAPGSR